MIYNPSSYYPDKIDPLIFFQDVDLEHLEIMEHFQNLIREEKYSEASKYINQQNGIHGAFAGLFNLIENRVYKLQRHLLAKEDINLHHFSEIEPDIPESEIWID